MSPFCFLLRASIWRSPFILFSFILFAPTLHSQYCVDGDYCPNPANDAGGTGNGCFVGIDDEYASAQSVIVDPSAAATCEINEAFGDIAMDENEFLRLFIGLSIGNSGQGTFRLYFNTDCDSTTGQINAAKNFGNTMCSQMALDTSTCQDVGGAEIMMLFTANGSSEAFYEWDTMTQAMVINNSLTDSIQLANGDLGGCSNSDGQFVEASLPLSDLFDFCSDDGCGSIELTSSLTNSGGSANSNFCKGIAFSLILPGNNPPTAIIDSLPPCLFSDQMVCLDGSKSIEMDVGDTVDYEWDLDFDGVSFDVDTTGQIVCLFFTPGTYTVGLRVTDRFGCMDTTDNMNALIFTIMDPSKRVQCEITDSSGVSCPGEMDGSFDFKIILGSPVYSYVVLNSGGVTVDSGMAIDSNSVVVISGLIADTYTLLVEDDNTCTDTCVVEITSADTIAPSIICPPDDTLDCPADTTTAGTGVATCNDGSAIITYRDSVESGACNGSFVLYRIWTATDTCNLDSSCIQIITVQDTTAPVILCPSDTTINCPGDTTSTGVATATEECTISAIITYRDSVEAGGCNGDFVLFRIWTAVDSCDNSTECIQTITVQDTMAPIILCPSDTTINCPGDTTTASTGVATATEECTASAIISYRDSVEAGGCNGDFVLLRIWTAADSCGNSTECIQTISVQDTTAPIILCPSDTTINCPGDTTTASTGVATATEECTVSAVISYRDSFEAVGCNGDFVLFRIWTAADSCGNSTECIQTITVQDTMAPIIICPSDTTINCPGDTTTASTGVATATEECTVSAVISYRDSVEVGRCNGDFVLFRIWTAADSCGNSTECIQTITVQDVTPPSIIIPSDTILDCPADTTTANTGTATGMDECNAAVIISYNDQVIPGACNGAYTLLRIWTAADSCGNMAVDTQMVLVQDTTPPVIVCPADLELSPSDSSDTSMTGVAMATDECGLESILYRDSTVLGICPILDTIFRIWAAVDSCGNESTCIQTIIRTEPLPQLAGLDSMDISCNSVLSYNLSNLLRNADTGGVWMQIEGSPVIITSDSLVDLSTLVLSDTLTFGYFISGSNPCLFDTSEHTLIVNMIPSAGLDSISTLCNSDSEFDLFSLLQQADLGGSWVQVSGTTVDISDPTMVDLTVVMNPDILVFNYFLMGVSPCEGDTSMAELTLVIMGNAGEDNSRTIFCGQSTVFDLTSLPVNADPGGSYIQIEGQAIDISDPTQVDIAPLVIGESVVFGYVIESDLPCTNDTARLTVNFDVRGSLICEGSINASAGVNCDFVFTADELLVSPLQGMYEITIGGITGIDTLVLDSSFVGQWTTFRVKNVCSGVSCWGDIHFEDKLLPEPNCEDDTLACDASIDPAYVGLPIPDSNVFTIESRSDQCFIISGWDACGEVELCWEDEDLGIECDQQFCSGIKRTWSVRELSRPDMVNTCMERIYILLPERDSALVPIDYLKPDNPISCADLNNNDIPDRLEDLWPPVSLDNPEIGNGIADREEEKLFGVSHEGSQDVLEGRTKTWIPLPSVTGYPLGELCTACVLQDWKDHVIDEGCSRYIEREWKILSWCTNQDLDTSFVQRIKIVDDEAPIVTNCPSDYTMYVGAHSCSVIGNLILPEAYDDCDDHSYTTGITLKATTDKGEIIEEGGSFTLKVDLSAYTQEGEHSTEVVVTWQIGDGCGNDTTCVSRIAVVDNAPPVASCVTEESISLTDGFGKMFAQESFDAGSHDNCNPVWFKVIRSDDEMVDEAKHGSSSVDLTGGGFPCGGVNGDDDQATDQYGVQLGYEVYFDDYVKFCCGDVGTQVKVLLRVYDWLPEEWREGPVPRSAHGDSSILAGHYNDCWVLVSVEDKLGNLECPDDIRITCVDELPESGGVVRTACGDQAAELIHEIDQRNSCGIGRLIRMWRSTDANGSYQECSQTITIDDTGDDFYIIDEECPNADGSNVDANDGITWPCDVVIPCEIIKDNGLAADDLVPELFEDGMGRPIINHDVGTCSGVFVGYEDLVLSQNDTCLKIVRTWRVIDWCGEAVTIYTPDSLGGNNGMGPGPGCANLGSKPMWCYEQILKIDDNEKPVMTVGVDVVCDEVDESCRYLTNIDVSATDNCTGLAENATWILTPDASLGLAVQHGTGLTYSGYLPEGIYHIRFDGEDRCGNKAHGEREFTVIDCKQPVPICNVGIGTVIMPSNGEVTVWAVDLDGGTKDDCSDLEFGVRRVGDTSAYTPSILLTCADLSASSANRVQLELEVKDAAGNADFCTTFIDLQDNKDVCGNGGPPISGTITTRQGITAVGHDVYLLDGQGEAIVETKTDAAGHYQFFDAAQGRYVMADKNDDVLNGINTLDMIAIQKHFLGIDVFDDPYHVLAGDVTKESSIDILDLLELQELILGLRSEFSNNRSWRYVSTDEDMSMSAVFDIQEPKDISMLTEEEKKQIDFVAVKVGDVDNTANPAGIEGGVVNSRSVLEFTIEAQDIELAEDNQMRIPVRSSNFDDIKGYQYTMNYDPTELTYISIESGALSISRDQVNTAKTHEAMISTNWYSTESESYTEDEALFTLVMRGERVGSIRVSDALTTSESYNGQDEVGGLTFDIRSTDVNISFALYQNVPNPFDQSTLIGFDLPDDATTVLKVYDVRGQEIYESAFDGSKGYNEYRLKRSDIAGASGVLYYRVETEGYKATKKMIVF